MLTAFIFMVKDKYGLFLTFLFVKSFITFAQLTSNTFIIKLKKKQPKKRFFEKGYILARDLMNTSHI